MPSAEVIFLLIRQSHGMLCKKKIMEKRCGKG